jgi:4-guanidinobutyraldehyde dehydrogenase / NAD-dependent aldehyde dehydrogenase
MTTISESPRTVADAVAGLDIRAQAFIDGEYVDALSGETFDCVSPISGEVVAQVAACDAEDVDRAVAGARAAFESGIWSRLAPKKRKQTLQRLA